MTEFTKEARARIATAMERVAKILREDFADDWVVRYEEANHACMRIATEEVLKVRTASDIRGYAATASDIMDRVVNSTITERRNGLHVAAKKKRKR